MCCEARRRAAPHGWQVTQSVEGDEGPVKVPAAEPPRRLKDPQELDCWIGCMDKAFMPSCKQVAVGFARLQTKIVKYRPELCWT